MKHFNCERKRPDTVIRNTKHGYAVRGKQHPVYRVWKSMNARCRSRQSPDYENYMLRGITVCKRWENFNNFFDDMADTYIPGLMIERVNNDNGYSKENCRWATRMEQNRNKRNVDLIEFNGKILTKREWGRELGGNDDLIYVRIGRGWSIERAVSTPAGRLGSNGSQTISR